MNTLKQKGIRAHVRDAGYRMSPDAWIELDKAVLTLLDRAMRYTRPQKTIRSAEIILALGKNNHTTATQEGTP